MSEALLFVLLFLAFGCIKVIFEIIQLFLKVHWKKELVYFKIADEVVSIYRKHKENKKQELSKWFKLKKQYTDYFNKKKQIKKDKIDYGIS